MGDDDGSMTHDPLPLTVLTKESIDDLPGIHGSRVGHVPWTHGSWVPPKVTYPGSGSERVLAVLKVQAQEPRPRMRLFTTFCQFGRGFSEPGILGVWADTPFWTYRGLGRWVPGHVMYGFDQCSAGIQCLDMGLGRWVPGIWMTRY